PSLGPRGMSGAAAPAEASVESAIGRGFSGLVAGLNSIGTAWIFALMVLINVDVLARYLFNAPIQGVAEMVELSIVGIVFLQISDAVSAGRLTRSDGVYRQILARRPKLGYSLGVVFDIAGALFFVSILLGAIPRLIEAYERGYFAGNEGLFTVPVWPIRLILVIGCIVCAAQFLRLAWRNLESLRASREAAE
ncbi:MAG TPA: TRAP transporter small permease, partial [Gammaproteobacteria bacterium]